MLEMLFKLTSVVLQQCTDQASTTTIVKAGFLTKSPPSGALKGGWKKRFFVLTTGTGEPKLEYVDSYRVTWILCHTRCRG